MKRYAVMFISIFAVAFSRGAEILVYRFTPLTETAYKWDSGRLRAGGYVVETTMDIAYSSQSEKEQIAAVAAKPLCPVHVWTTSLSVEFSRSAESYNVGISSYYVLTWDPKLTPAQSPSGRFVNLSTRVVVGEGGTMIAGFVVGDSPKRVLVRAIGPGLKQFSVPNTMVNPKLELYAGSSKIAENNDWNETASNGERVFAANIMSGAFALDPVSTDAAMVATLNPGAYTVHVRDVSSQSGDVLLELYHVP